jgi:dTDP-glucose 4,6-dehydratase
MRVLVTGGAGFIGSNFVRRAIQGYYPEISELAVLDKLTYAGNIENLRAAPSDSFEFIKGDICDQALVKPLVKKFDAIVNFAAESHVDRSIHSSTEFIHTNILGVQVLLDALKDSRGKRFVQISTDEVYGSIEVGSWDEQEPIKPNSPYSASKASADLLAMAYFRTFGTDVVVTRSSNNYGPFQFPEKLISLSITNTMENRNIQLYGNGLNVRDWLHVDDHCRGIYLALTRGISGQVYNIGGGQELTNLEISKLILNEFGLNDSRIVFVGDRLGHDFRYSVSWEKANRALGYQPSVPFETGLVDTIDWYRRNESWWKPLSKK